MTGMQRVTELVGRVMAPTGPARPCPRHAAAGECAAFRRLAVAVLAAADRLDSHAAHVQAAPIPDCTPAAAYVVQRGDRAADLMRAAEDLRAAVTAATEGGHP